jgi:hypothetical protein
MKYLLVCVYLVVLKINKYVFIYLSTVKTKYFCLLVILIMLYNVNKHESGMSLGNSKVNVEYTVAD